MTDVKQYKQKHYEKNRDEVLVKNKLYYHDHKDERREYNLNRKEQIKLYNKAYYEKNKTELIQKIRVYKKTHSIKYKKRTYTDVQIQARNLYQREYAKKQRIKKHFNLVLIEMLSLKQFKRKRLIIVEN